jgi:hypothetical protein
MSKDDFRHTVYLPLGFILAIIPVHYPTPIPDPVNIVPIRTVYILNHVHMPCGGMLWFPYRFDWEIDIGIPVQSAVSLVGGETLSSCTSTYLILIMALSNILMPTSHPVTSPHVEPFIHNLVSAGIECPGTRSGARVQDLISQSHRPSS